MPRRGLGRAGLLDQDVFVEHLHRLRLHDAPGNGSRRRLADKVIERRNALPVAVVLEEAPAFAGPYVLDGKGAGLGQVLRKAVAQPFDPVGEGAAQYQHAVALVGVDLFLGDVHGDVVWGRCAQYRHALGIGKAYISYVAI